MLLARALARRALARCLSRSSERRKRSRLAPANSVPISWKRTPPDANSAAPVRDRAVRKPMRLAFGAELQVQVWTVAALGIPGTGAARVAALARDLRQRALDHRQRCLTKLASNASLPITKVKVLLRHRVVKWIS